MNRRLTLITAVLGVVAFALVLTGCEKSLSYDFNVTTGDTITVTLNTTDGEYKLKNDDGTFKVMKKDSDEAVLVGKWYDEQKLPYEQMKADNMILKEGEIAFVTSDGKDDVWVIHATDKTNICMFVNPEYEKVVDLLSFAVNGDETPIPFKDGMKDTETAEEPATEPPTTAQQTTEATTQQTTESATQPATDNVAFTLDRELMFEGVCMVGDKIPAGTYVLKGHGEGELSVYHDGNKTFTFAFNESNPIDGQTVTLANKDTVFFAGDGSVDAIAK